MAYPFCQIFLRNRDHHAMSCHSLPVDATEQFILLLVSSLRGKPALSLGLRNLRLSKFVTTDRFCYMRFLNTCDFLPVSPAIT